MRRLARIVDLVRSPFRRRLSWRVTFAVFASIFLIEAAILVPSYKNYERDLLARLDEVGRSVVFAAMVLNRGQGIEDLVATAEVLSRNSKLVGGAFHRPGGGLLGTFGERPGTPAARLLAGGARRVRPDRYEAVWSMQVRGLDVSVVGRLDSSTVPGALRAFLWRIAGLVLLITAFVGAVTMLILNRSVLGPLLRIRDNLAAAHNDPAHADHYALPERGIDEVGEVIAALNSLFRRVSKTHREDLAAMVAMADNASEGIIAYDRSWNVVYANRACMRFCNLRGLAHFQDRAVPRFRLAGRSGSFSLAEMLAEGQFSGEATLIGEGQRRTPCYVNATTLDDDRGRVFRYYALITDITRLHDARRHLERQNLELEESNRAKGEFLANMSHELRTPLNAVIGFSELMRNEVFGELGAPQYREYVDDVHASGIHLLEIINNILDLSKIEVGRFELREEELDPAGTIESSIRLIRERAESRNITVRTRLPEALPRLFADGQKLKQILINLLSNAVKFTPDGGRVEVSAAQEKNGGLAISVADTGIGIAATDLGRVLLPFSQAESGLSRKFDGTGLGLPLAKAMVELHSGTLELVSRLDRGTTVTLHFPSARLVV